jgi:two-component system LytT family sensor kinase
VTDTLVLITLLVKLGVAASVASALARSHTFQRLLFEETRNRRQTLGLMAFMVGPGWATLGGMVLSIPAMIHGEYLALPFNAAVGLGAGLLGRFLETEEIWSFTPFIDLSLWRWVRRNLIKPRIDRQILMLFLIGGMEICREWTARNLPHPTGRRRLFALITDNWWLQILVWLCAPMVVGIVLKVWNALRIELKLEEQKRLLLEARLDALQRQINPHFLFNTLNSIAALVRSQPELARELTVKLANILRALLKDHDTYVPLRDELRFTDDYLDIEVVRFGAHKLKVEKDIDPRTLSVMVPSILLQPLIENSIKHGLEPRINGGTVTLRSRFEGDRVLIEVADDGVGMGTRPASALRRTGAGIGMKNVQERLDVLYGSEAHFNIVSNPGRGTLVSIEIPAILTETG